MLCDAAMRRIHLSDLMVIVERCVTNERRMKSGRGPLGPRAAGRKALILRDQRDAAATAANMGCRGAAATQPLCICSAADWPPEAAKPGRAII
jgi:hypothetical protein